MSADDSGTKGDGPRTSAPRGSPARPSRTRRSDSATRSPTWVATATVAADGTYTVQAPLSLGDGNVAVQVREQDLAGNFSAFSTQLIFVVDGTAPAAPASPGLVSTDDSGTKGTASPT
ncbi:MAG: Ig-like domain-containing protein [Isosphaeraceae bacterium]